MSHCEARPPAARTGHEEDAFCRGAAVDVVRFRGVDVPVCRLHAATYREWGADAEVTAERTWEWSRATLPSG